MATGIFCTINYVGATLSTHIQKLGSPPITPSKSNTPVTIKYIINQTNLFLLFFLKRFVVLKIF